MASASLLLLLATATAATFSPSRCISGCGGSPALASFSDARTRITSSYNNYNSINSYNNHNSYSSYGQTRPTAPSPSPAWAEVVPSRLASVPGQVASIRWGDNIRLLHFLTYMLRTPLCVWCVRWGKFTPGVGDTMLTGQMEDRPEVGWEAGPGELYTVMILDEGISFLNGKQYVHWLVTNVPGDGSNKDGITEMMRYVEPFSASAADPKHPMLVLVYRQRARVMMEEYQRGCSPSVVNDR